jgi:glutamyl-tRNA reductase
MQLFAFGINHHTAPLDVREQVTFPENTMEHALHDLIGRNLIRKQPS